MSKITAPIERINEILVSKKHYGKVINHEVLNELGIFILKQPLGKQIIKKYVAFYFDSKLELERQPFHLTMVNASNDHPLNNILKEPEFLKLISEFYNGNIGSDYVNIFRKDKTDTKPVFLHQDSSYLVGYFDKYSLFISLTPCHRRNGGLVVYPGTHYFGHLGDAGEIDSNILPLNYPKIEVDTEVGDILVMHSAIWHESPENVEHSERIYLEIKIRDANDPSTKNIICGERTSEWSLPLSPDEIFKNSRTQRLKNLYNQIELLKSKDVQSDIGY